MQVAYFGSEPREQENRRGGHYSRKGKKWNSRMSYQVGTPSFQKSSEGNLKMTCLSEGSLLGPVSHWDSSFMLVNSPAPPTDKGECWAALPDLPCRRQVEVQPWREGMVLRIASYRVSRRLPRSGLCKMAGTKRGARGTYRDAQGVPITLDVPSKKIIFFFFL